MADYCTFKLYKVTCRSDSTVALSQDKTMYVLAESSMQAEVLALSTMKTRGWKFDHSVSKIEVVAGDNQYFEPNLIVPHYVKGQEA